MITEMDKSWSLPTDNVHARLNTKLDAKCAAGWALWYLIFDAQLVHTSDGRNGLYFRWLAGTYPPWLEAETQHSAKVGQNGQCLHKPAIIHLPVLAAETEPDLFTLKYK